jgi:hypothetical protein
MTTKTIAKKPRGKSGWSLPIKQQEAKQQMNISVSSSIKSDIELLTTHFQTSTAEVVDHLLRHALDTNADIAELRRASRPGSPADTDSAPIKA